MNNALVRNYFIFYKKCRTGAEGERNMKITTRKASTLAIALAVPATSIAGTSAALAEDSTSGKEISINVNLGSDAADSDVTLLAGDEEVGTETADESGKVSFSYNGKDTEELTVEVDGESITLSDAQCTAAKDSTGSTASGSDSASAGESTDPSSDPSSSVDPSEGGSSDSSKPDISSIVDKISGKASDLINGAGSGIGGGSTSSDPSAESTASNKPSTESTTSSKPSAESTTSNKPSTESRTDSENTDGSGSRIPEALEKIEKQSDINSSSNKTIQGDAKEAEKLSKNLKKLESSKDAENLNLDRSKIESTVNDLDKAIKEQEADGTIQITPELQEKIASLAKAAVGTAYPQYAPIANPVIDVSSKVVASAINLLAEEIDLGSILGKDGSSSDSSEGTTPENGTPASSSQDGESDGSNSSSSSDEVDLDSNVEDKSFTVNLQEGVSSVDCDVETESSDEDEDEGEDTSSASDNGSETSQAPESPTPASGSGSAAAGPKVNTGGEVQGKSFFSKIKSLF